MPREAKKEKGRKKGKEGKREETTLEELNFEGRQGRKKKDLVIYEDIYSITSDSVSSTSNISCVHSVDTTNSSSVLCSAEIVEDLFEKLYDIKRGKKVPLLNKLLNIFQNFYLPEVLHDRQETIISTLMQSVVRGDEEENQIACRILAIIFFHIGKNKLSLDIYEEIENKVCMLCKTSKKISIKSNSILLYAILAFMGCNYDEKFDEACDWFEAYAKNYNFNEIKSKVDTACCEAESIVKGWAIIATLWKTKHLADFHILNKSKSLWEFAIRCAEQFNADLKIASCGVIGMMLEAKWYTEDDLTIETLEENHKREFALLREISQTGGERLHQKGLDKIEKKNVLKCLRNLLNTAESGESPSFTLYIGYNTKEKYEVSSWLSIVRYDIIKEYLKGATELHLKENKDIAMLVFLDDIPNFSSFTNKLGRITAIERETLQKQKCKERARLRDNKANALESC